MKKIYTFILSAAALTALAGCSHLYFDTEAPQAETKSTATSYTNPVMDSACPDPTVIKADNGYFYLYCSDEADANLPIFRSKDLLTWKKVGTIFSPYARPTWANTTNIGLWAPDIAKVGNKYVLYYALANYTLDGMDRNWGYGIGAAVADSPEGPFQDCGAIIRSGEIRVMCSIDPCYFEDNGKKYLVWGSFFGLWAIELSEDGLSVKEGAEKVHLAGSRSATWGLEAAMVHKKGNYYYLFASANGTGYDENYQVTVFRSDAFLGPYVDQDGKAAISNTRVGRTLLQGGSNFVSPGHTSELITDDAGVDWLFFHAYRKDDRSKRVPLMEKVNWVDGWPELGVDEGGIKTPNLTVNSVPTVK